MKTYVCKSVLVIVAFLVLQGCTLPTRYERDPNDIGWGNDDYKKSKCACNAFYKHGKWL